MEKRKCKKCNEVSELNENNFKKIFDKKMGKFYFRGTCNKCRLADETYYNKLRKLKKEKAQQDEWKQKFINQTFICKYCNKEKTFDEMRVNSTNKAMENRCKKCFNIRHKEIYLPNLMGKSFSMASDEASARKRNEIE